MTNLNVGQASRLASRRSRREYGLRARRCALAGRAGRRRDACPTFLDRSCLHALRFDLRRIRAFDRPGGFDSLAQAGQPREWRPLGGRTSRPNPPHESAAARIKLRQPRSRQANEKLVAVFVLLANAARGIEQAQQLCPRGTSGRSGPGVFLRSDSWTAARE